MYTSCKKALVLSTFDQMIRHCLEITFITKIKNQGDSDTLNLKKYSLISYGMTLLHSMLLPSTIVKNNLNFLDYGRSFSEFGFLKTV